jgi:hypothetical protein
MANPSNLYAERIYSEHPVAMWALDDNANYAKLMSDARLTLHTPTTFSKSNIQNTIGITDFSSYQTPPISEASTTEITLSTFATPWGTSKTASIYPSTATTIDSSVSSFTISFYYYAANPYISSIKVGYLIGSTLTSSETFTINQNNSWQFISKTFSNPTSQAVKLYLEFTYSENPTLTGTTDNYVILINSLSMGYASEEFNKKSVGISQSVYTAIDLNTTISGFTTGTNGVVADSYGISDTGSNGYYCVRFGKLLAKNSQVPMVFGSANSTIIYPNPTASDPSLIFPAQGFLNQTGKNNQYTFEFWLRARVLKNNAVQKIFGPLSSTDGLYVNKNAMTIKVGNQIGSYYVGEWYRPLLIDIKYSPSQVTLLVNGETVISLPISTSDTDLFPEKIVSSKNQDWVGFYANGSTGVSLIEIDGVAIYPYQVDNTLVKRRYVFGQGVEFPQNIDVAYNGKSYLADFNAANYANNYKYPGIKKWESKVNDNFTIQDGTLSTPTLSLPSINFEDSLKTYSTWYATQSTTNYFTLATSGHNGYLSYDSLSILDNSDIRGFVISATSNSAYVVGVSQTIFKLVNKNNDNYLVARLVPTSTSSATIKYFYKIGSSAEAELDVSLNYVVAVSSPYTVGIDLVTFTQKYASQIGSLLSSQSSLKMYIGNEESFTNQLKGNIYSVGFMSNYNFSQNFGFTSSLFGAGGVITNTGTGRTAAQTQTYVTTGYGSSNYVHSYRLKMTTPLGGATYSFDIATNSNWQDYVPIKTLSTYTTNASTLEQTYELDFIQFNIDYPEPCAFVSTNYDTSNSDIKTYVYFKYLDTGSYVDASTLTSVNIPSHGTVVPTSSWVTEKYEVVNGAIIYLPNSYLDVGKEINDLSMGIFVQSKNTTSILSPIKIRSLQLASKAFDIETVKWKNGFETKFGNKIYPYTHRTADSATVFNYKDKNPYRIYKGNTPYLYLTRDSGIKIFSEYSNGLSDSKGIMIPVNESSDADYNLSSLQMFVRSESTQFPATETKIFSLNYNLNNTTPTTIDFYMIATSTAANRAKIYAKIASTEYTDIVYYINGVETANPVLSIGEWSSIGIAFKTLLDFDNYLGDIKLLGPLTFNNISYYQYTGLQSNTKYANQRWNYYQHSPWSQYDTLGELPGGWASVLATTYSAVSGIDPTESYNAMIGTNKAIFDNSDSESELRVRESSKKIVSSTEWQSSTRKPV